MTEEQAKRDAEEAVAMLKAIAEMLAVLAKAGPGHVPAMW